LKLLLNNGRRGGDGMNNEGERERRRGKEEPTNYKRCE
jgi:hypothetical protein